jgi:hypothetical protein
MRPRFHRGKMPVSRARLTDVPRLGPKAFEQHAGYADFESDFGGARLCALRHSRLPIQSIQ